MAEMYTTTSAANSVGGPEEDRGRVRLVHHGTQIADFGIVKGPANVKAQDHFMYLFLNYGAVFEKGQDPNDHYWIYFITVNGAEDFILDCGMFVFNNPLFVVPFPHYTKFIPSSLPGITAPAVPAYFTPREATKREWLPKAHHEQQRFSVLRDEGLREVIRFSHEEFRPIDEEAITQFMERVAGMRAQALRKQSLSNGARLARL